LPHYLRSGHLSSCSPELLPVGEIGKLITFLFKIIRNWIPLHTTKPTVLPINGKHHYHAAGLFKISGSFDAGLIRLVLGGFLCMMHISSCSGVLYAHLSYG